MVNPATLEITAHLQGESVDEFLVLLCFHMQLLLYLVNSLYLNLQVLIHFYFSYSLLSPIAVSKQLCRV